VLPRRRLIYEKSPLCSFILAGRSDGAAFRWGRDFAAWLGVVHELLRKHYFCTAKYARYPHTIGFVRKTLTFATTCIY